MLVHAIYSEKTKATVEREELEAALVDGVGEVWVRGESSTVPSKYWVELAPNSTFLEYAGGPAVAAPDVRNDEDTPFGLLFEPSEVAALGLRLEKPGVKTPVGDAMVVRVVAEDAYGNERDGWFGTASVVCRGEARGGGDVLVENGEGRVEFFSQRAEEIQVSFTSCSDPSLRISSILRGSFAHVDAVRAVFGAIPTEPQPAGEPFQLPLVVLDRFDNECETYSGSFAVTMTGDARVAGDLPPTFEVSGGRAMLPIIDQTAEMVTFTVHNAVLGSGGDGGAVDEATQTPVPGTPRPGGSSAGGGMSSPEQVQVSLPPDANTQVCRVVFGPGDAERLELKVGRPGDEKGYTAPRPTDKSARSLAFPPTSSFAPAAADGDGDDDEEGGGGSSPTQYAAGEEVVVRIRALDRHDNLVKSQECWFTLEATTTPKLDHDLSSATTKAQPAATAQPYLLQLRNGVAEEYLTLTVAGEVSLRLTRPNVTSLDVSASAVLRVIAGKATSVDVVNIPEAATARSMQLVVHARDMYGNVDETFEQEVAIDYDGQLPDGEELVLPKDGLVRLERGVQRLTVPRRRVGGSPLKENPGVNY